MAPSTDSGIGASVAKSGEKSGADAGKWYDLFSRGARDWLRHDEKVRESVRKHLPQIVSGGDVINDTSRTVRVPVKMLEHYHFRLRRPEEQQGAGQGKAKPGDVFSDPSKQRGPGEKGPGGQDDGEMQLLLEFKIDDIVDWLWEEMKLPNIKARVGPSEESEWIREGYDRRGARSRLDRRRSFKEMVKRRGNPGATPTFIDDDLRFRQLARRRQPALHAVVFFLLDVSGSMSDRDQGSSPPKPSSSGSCKGCAANTARSRRCSSATPPRPGTSPKASSSR